MTFNAISVIERTLVNAKSDKQKMLETIESKLYFINQEESKEKIVQNEIEELQDVQFCLVHEIEELRVAIKEFDNHDWH